MKELWSALGHIAMDGVLLESLQGLGTSAEPTINQLKEVRGVLYAYDTLLLNRQETWQVNHIVVESKEKPRLNRAFELIAEAAEQKAGELGKLADKEDLVDPLLEEISQKIARFLNEGLTVNYCEVVAGSAQGSYAN